MWDELADAVRGMIRRVTLSSVDDSGKQQKMTVKGLKGETLKDVVRVQPFGFSSHPPEGAEGILVALGGRSDRAMLIGIEHPDHRPKAKKAGSSIQYDANGNSVLLDDTALTITGATKAKVVVGGNSIEITSSGIVIVGNVTITGTLMNNGKNVGSTHTHSGVQSGPSNTGQPV